jgi:hypothetical protein
MMMPAAAAVHARLDKLNVYLPGGFFKPHIGTPRSPDMFGTLVLPSGRARGRRAARAARRARRRARVGRAQRARGAVGGALFRLRARSASPSRRARA